MTRVLALDPGEKVGWARADIAENGDWTNLRHGITPLRDMVLAVHAALTINCEHYDPPLDPTYDVIVIEDWRLRPDKAHSMIGSSFPSVQFIGAVRLCCWVSGTKLVTQQPSERNLANKPMKALRPDLYELVTKPISHDDGHDQDALKHLWFYTWRHCEVPVTVMEPAA